MKLDATGCSICARFDFQIVIHLHALSKRFTADRFNGLTVLQNVTLAAHYGGARLTDAQALAEAREWMLFTGLQDKGDHFPDELNLHQRKFLELARALAARPQVLLLDEVLSGLTPSEMSAAVQTIRRIRERGTSIVFVEHVMSAVLALSDRLVVLNQGEVIAEGRAVGDGGLHGQSRAGVGLDVLVLSLENDGL